MDSKANKLPYNLPDDAVWFITGCSTGIGNSLAKLLLQHPTYRVVATARKPSTLSQLGVPGSEDRLLATALDVTSTESIDAAVAAALSRFGRIDVLVNNAGYGLFGDAEACTRETERALFETNLWGPVALSKHAVRIMREENPKTGPIGGVIMNVSSMGGFITVPSHTFYHASKFALEGFTQGFAKEMRPEWNIHFCIAEPGGVQTEFSSNVNPGHRHPAYDAPDTPSRIIESYLANPESRKYWAKSEPTARAMIEIITGAKEGAKGRIPARVPIGINAFTAVKAEAAKISAELEEFKELSVSTQIELSEELKTLVGH
ncbi:retinol dehydrogenase 8 [Pyricularia oryzae Y34]|uniref:Retinol dehydrogenase 8 n=2 Tax=Pyricularia oryzae TaxID=318829 RepID=A0AA97NYR7_PYRO3|nr:retinol dehydrogenase 8 [Pyricularia oryzae Y34]